MSWKSAQRVAAVVWFILATYPGCSGETAPADETERVDQADGDPATAGDGVEEPDSDVRDVADITDEATDVEAPSDSDGDVQPDTTGDPDADVQPNVDADVDVDADLDIDPDVDVQPPPVGCVDLNCTDEGRACVESDGTADAECGDCLAGFADVAGECEAPSCRGDGDCTPEPIADEWSSCGGYETSCSVDGTQTRLVYSGECVSGRCEVTSVEQSRPCLELRQTEGDPCVVDAAVGECRSGTCAVVPGQVTGVSASDGTSSAFVRVTWSAVEGATGYHVYRNGVRLTTSPVTLLAFEDATAVAGAAPAQVTGLTATAATDRITLTWTAASSTGSAGSAETYTVAAVNDAGEGPASAADSGNRAGFALNGYEVRINGSGSWLSAGTSTSFADTAAPEGTITVSDVTASDGTSTAHVTLSATVSTSPGASRSYEVRALNAAGAGAASSSVSRQRSVGTAALQWQRSSGTTASEFGDIGGATSSPFNDTGAPSDGATRHYRLVVSAAGATTVTSSSDSGFRQVTGPAPGTLGGICDSDSQCPSGTWCSTVSGFRRCSPRLFSGQSHQMDFVYVPAGTFQQGTTGAMNEERPYTATLTRNYFVSRTEVTRGQWQAVYGALPADISNPDCGSTCPLDWVNWYEGVDLANRLSEQSGLSLCYATDGCMGTVGLGSTDAELNYECESVTYHPECSGYRLLTESEWERAARGGTSTAFYWGESDESAVGSLYAWFNVNSDRRVHPVAEKLPNSYGLFDVSGNTAEWVWDRVYSNGAFLEYPIDSAADYTGPATGLLRGQRGGNYEYGVFGLRVAHRGLGFPMSPGNPDAVGTVGIRLARTVP